MGQPAFDLQKDVYGAKAVVCFVCVLRSSKLFFSLIEVNYLMMLCCL